MKELLNAPEIAGNADVKPFLEQAQFAVPMPAIPEMKYYWAPVGAALAESWDGKIGVKKSLETAKKTLEEAISLGQ